MKGENGPLYDENKALIATLIKHKIANKNPERLEQKEERSSSAVLRWLCRMKNEVGELRGEEELSKTVGVIDAWGSNEVHDGSFQVLQKNID